mmetsp:Transcript_30498/g.97478  ORF Transcript_30498/g.97478 Transcript_30498/m.97478 type:complete len:304 (-) Transcript_30498:1099-2010(-)
MLKHQQRKLHQPSVFGFGFGMRFSNRAAVCRFWSMPISCSALTFLAISVSFTVGLIQPSAGPAPCTRFTRILPFLPAASCSMMVHCCRRPTSADLMLSPSRTRQDDATTPQRRPFSKSVFRWAISVICLSAFSLRLGNFLMSSLLHFEKSASFFIFECFLRFSFNASVKTACLFAQLPVNTSSCMKRLMISEVLAQPSSFAMLSASLRTFTRITSSSQQARIAEERSSTVAFAKRPVAVPILLSLMSLAISCWSAKTGVMTVGQPAPREACVVPMPPWCTAARHWGKSHSCGALLMKSTFLAQ